MIDFGDEINAKVFDKPSMPAVGQAAGAAGDFVSNYVDMRNANTIGADKYFHCMANCQAAQRGQAGAATAAAISDAREGFDAMVKGDPPDACEADQAANRAGRQAGAQASNAPPGSPPPSCASGCSQYRPSALPPQY